MQSSRPLTLLGIIGYGMNRRLQIILGVALLASLLACIFVARNMGNKSAAAPKMVTQKLVAAKTDIKLGTILHDADLTLVDYAGTPPVGTIQEQNKQSLIGRGVIAELYPGEPIQDARLAPAGMGGGLAPTIPSGMRDVAVKVDDVEDLAGFVTPGMHVDVLVIGTPPSTSDNANPEVTQVRTILQNLQVLSAGSNIQRDAEGKPLTVQVVNLLVTPEQAETLSLASNQAHVQLALRNPLDTKTLDVTGDNLTALYTKNGVKVVHLKVNKPAAPHTYSVEVFNGTKGSVVKFPAPEGQL